MTPNNANLADKLIREYGPMIGGRDLYSALGFKSYGAFRLAKERGEIPIEIFKLPKRRDWYALTSDLAEWLMSLTHATDCNIQNKELPFKKTTPLWTKGGKFEIAKGSSEPLTTKAGNKYIVSRFIKATASRARDGQPLHSNYAIVLTVKL